MFSKIFGIGLLSISITALADSDTPNFDSSTGILTVPIVSMDENIWFGDIELKLDFSTSQFTLLNATPIDEPLDESIDTPNSTDNPKEPLINVFTEVDAIDEVEPNDSTGSTQELDAIGANRPVKASIGYVEDVDFYAFDAVAGRTYTVDLFDVANNLTLTGDSGKCESYRTYEGIFPIIYDPAENEIGRQCEPNGAGNVHTVSQFIAGVTGTYHIRVASHGNSVLGTYFLRILPQYDESGAIWNLDTFEPNNWLKNAYPIEIGVTKALTSQIEAGKNQFATVNGDIDSYRILAKAGETFVVELFDVANNLTLAGDSGKCESYRTYEGIFPIVYDPAYNEIIRQCEPNGKGEVHSFTTFTAGIDGTYIIRIMPHGNSVSGTYSVRVLKQEM